MTLKCPLCNSRNLETLDYGKKTGAIIGALLGGTAGGAAGAKIGQVIDERYLDNNHCLNCGHTFSTQSAEEMADEQQKLPYRR